MSNSHETLQPEIYLEKIKESYLEGYKDSVEKRMLYQFKNSPENFPIFKDSKWNITLIQLDSDFFEYPNVILISNNPEQNEYIYKDKQYDKIYLSQNYSQDVNSPEKYIYKELPIIDFNNSDWVMEIFFGPIEIIDYQLSNRLETYYSAGKRKASEHLRDYKEVSTQKMKDKNHQNISPFNHLNLDDMKRIVHDDTFDYQINQGLEAYKRELYLPAAATFAVAIETFLIKLKVANNIKHKSSDSTMYDKLLEDLKRENKINYRTKKRVEVAYAMRNIINHTQAGAVAKADCDFLLNTLKDLVDNNQETITEYDKSIDDSK